MEGGNFPSSLPIFTNVSHEVEIAVNDGSKKNADVAVRGQEQFLPVANIVRIMRKVLPTNAKISDDTKETIQECVSEFISFITSEANERCQREHRKTVTAEDLIWAMGKLGFDDYIQPLTSYVNGYRRIETGRTPIQTEYIHVHGDMPRNNVLNANNNYGHKTQMFDLMGMEHQQLNANYGLGGPVQAGPGDGYYYYEDSSGLASASGSAVGGYSSNSGMFDFDYQYGQFK